MIRAYDLSEDGTVSNMRVFHDFYPGRSGDGMTVDSEGNLYVAAGFNRRRGTSETLDTEAGVHPRSTTSRTFRGGVTTTSLHLIERFTRVSPGTLMYEVTVEDPAAWTRSWTYAIPMVKSE